MNPFISRVSVIVCAYTELRWDDMLYAVDSLRAQTHPASEIILVIDHNSTLYERAQVQFPDLTVVTNTEKRGLSGARNSGIAVAHGDIIAFMDEDAVADSEWLKHLDAGFLDPKVIGVGGAIIPWWIAKQPAWFPEEFNCLPGCTIRSLHIRLEKYQRARSTLPFRTKGTGSPSGTGSAHQFAVFHRPLLCRRVIQSPRVASGWRSRRSFF